MCIIYNNTLYVYNIILCSYETTKTCLLPSRRYNIRNVNDLYYIYVCSGCGVFTRYILYEMKYLKQIHSIRIRVKFEHTTYPDVVNGGDVFNTPEAR